MRVDSRRFPTDFPPSGLNVDGVPTGGWWNYGGIQREVYLRRVDTVDFKRSTCAPARCGACNARVSVSVDLRNVTGGSKRVSVTGRFGDHTAAARHARHRGRRDRAASRRRSRPQPAAVVTGEPDLYDVSLTVRAGSRRVAATCCAAASGRSRSSNGHLVLNGQHLNFRGVGMHEDSKEQGFAIDNAVREQIATEAKALGATVLRTHYPMHPYTARARRPRSGF